jgi:hypothetical protein
VSNVLTSLAADIYLAADKVGRELTGIIPSVIVNSGSQAVAQNDTVRSHFTRSVSTVTPSPAMTIPEGTDQTVDSKTMTIDTLAAVQIPWTGEDIKHVNNGSGFETIYGDQIRQAMRALTNKIELDLWNAVRKGASRAYGTAGTTPFASNFNELPQLRKILEDNGCPFDGQLSVIMDTTAAANLRSLSNLQKVNEAGNEELLRQGTMLDLIGFMLKSSGQIGTVTKGTGSGYLVNNGPGYAVGIDAITTDTGTGTILAGDILTNTFASRDSNKYVVGTALASNVVTLNDPGIRVAWVDNDTLAVGANFTANVALHKTAAEIAIRPIAVPPGGDAAVDSMTVTDPFSGLVFTIRAYKGYLKAMFDISVAYGVKAWKPQHIAILLG